VCRVTSKNEDLERQQQVLELYCARRGWTFEVVADLGSGMNYHKKGLKSCAPSAALRHRALLEVSGETPEGKTSGALRAWRNANRVIFHWRRTSLA
jgi:hypothetical protein